MTFAPPPAAGVQRRPGRIPHFPDSTSPRLALSPIGQSGLHTANQNGGDLYPYDDETSQSGDM
jgi:hypothetical protein